MVNLHHDLQLILLEEGVISYDEYCEQVPSHAIPPEYATFILFCKNRGKVSKRIISRIKKV